MNQNTLTGKLQAIVLEMDVLMVKSALIHKKAWNKLWRELSKKQQLNSQKLTDEEYEKYLKYPAEPGQLRDFLKSKGFPLQYGDPEDSPGKETIWGLINSQKLIYNQILENNPELDSKVIESIKTWKNSGIKTAVVSPDKNCGEILKTAGITKLFDTWIDGPVSNSKGLKEKPEGDIYLEALKQLDVQPESSVLIDTSVAGVRAGCKTNFAVVAGLAENGEKKLLSENGADMVFDQFEELNLLNNPEIDAWLSDPIPPFQSEYLKIGQKIFGKSPVLFLDYDGTLSPIVKRPEDAVISKEMKAVLQKCSTRFTVAAISGRDMDDLKSKINLENLIYAGSHGFRISGPEGLYMEHEKSYEILPRLNKIENNLHQDFKNVKGVQIDRKRYAIAIHFRNANENDIPFIKQKVDEMVKNSPGFKKGEGKKILEIKPDLDWHKGKALLWILEKLQLTDKSKYIPVYIGDDVTDEDAYKAIEKEGIGIQVGPVEYSTSAKFRLKNVYQVRLFLKELLNLTDE